MRIMIIVSLLIATSGWSQEQPHAYLAINEEHIAQVKQELQRELLANQKVRALTTTAGILLGIGVAYQAWRALTDSNYLTILNCKQPSFGSAKWFARFLVATRDSICISVASTYSIAALEVLKKKIYYTADLDWYIHNHTHLPATMQELSYWAAQLDIGAHTNDYAWKQFQWHLGSMLSQYEMIIAYIESKLAKTDHQLYHVSLIEQLPAQMRAIVTTCIQDCFAQTVQASAYSIIVETFERALNALLNSFIYLDEDSVWINQRTVHTRN